MGGGDGVEERERNGGMGRKGGGRGEAESCKA